jgi:hypothetical protein
MTPDDLARRLFEAYADGDRDTIRSLLADDLIAYVTNADAGVDKVCGVEAYMERLPDLHAAGGRGGRQLHNFAAFLAQVSDGRVTKLWMVDALPAYSDEFWS